MWILYGQHVFESWTCQNLSINLDLWFLIMNIRDVTLQTISCVSSWSFSIKIRFVGDLSGNLKFSQILLSCWWDYNFINFLDEILTFQNSSKWCYFNFWKECKNVLSQNYTKFLNQSHVKPTMFWSEELRLTPENLLNSF